MCLFPTLAPNPKYRVNKKNGGNVPQLSDARLGYVPIKCGWCMECMKAEANKWRTRLFEDIKEHKNGKFITLTFSDESYKELADAVNKKMKKPVAGYLLDNKIATLGVRRFLERWRKETKQSVRHWLVTELGHEGTENVHLHGIIYTDDIEQIRKHWKYGYIWPRPKSKWIKKNYVNERTINYIVKYIMKADKDHKAYKAKILTSAGIGSAYTKTKDFQRAKYQGEDTKEYYVTRKGQKTQMNIYYRNKLYSEEEREALWLMKLDKGIRYIGGQKVDAEDTKAIDALTEFYRKKNNRLGYGSPENWNVKEYEEARRRLIQAVRIERANKKNSK